MSVYVSVCVRKEGCICNYMYLCVREREQEKERERTRERENKREKNREKDKQQISRPMETPKTKGKWEIGVKRRRNRMCTCWHSLL